MHRLPLTTLLLVLLAGLVLLSSCSEDGAIRPTVPDPPAILGQDASGVDHASATLGGWVDGRGRATVCWFDYGNDITYGARSPGFDIGAAAGPVRVEYELTGLDPSKLHWWRLVAVAGDDTVAAADTTFATLPMPNEAPDTRTIQAPLSGNVVHLYWTGSDPDGAVVGYRWRLSDNGLDGTIDEPDTLGLAWHFTTLTDSVFTVSADQPDVPPNFAQVHTFWIKAVDDRGAEDPAPAYLTFTAVSEAPVVAVTMTPAGGTMPDGCLDVSIPAGFTWTATDPDGPAEAVLEVRTFLVDLADLGHATCLTRAQYEALAPLATVDEALWGPWNVYDPSDPLPPAFDLGPQHVAGRYLFAAMARDGAGAWTRDLIWGGNVWQVEVLPD